MIPLRVYALTHLQLTWTRTTFFQGREIDRLSLCRIPAVGIPEEGIPGGAILASRVPIDGTKDAGRRLWIRFQEPCQASGFSLNQNLPTLFTLRSDESEIFAVMSSNVDELLYGYLPAEVMSSVLNSWSARKKTLESVFRPRTKQNACKLLSTMPNKAY